MAADIDRALAQPVQLAEGLVSTGASLGIAVSTPGLNESDMLRHADTAMYAAKASGRPVLYTDELDKGRVERLAMLADLHHALERDELELLYQPQLDLTTGSIVAVEALVRWRHPALGSARAGLVHPARRVDRPDPSAHRRGPAQGAGASAGSGPTPASSSPWP